ncbi:hypothetical protein BGL_1c17960 [Burkholderia plantarii]|uniref:Putative tail fiber protein gp53-like C-terminal domain-containing protein n=2 Tax=Burkholderia plantarii TaxID=41899 RepID=A0A0B6RZ12_BURPL|nr:hypothetical protein BGL_1c17960 [Burkholderia plantarii]
MAKNDFKAFATGDGANVLSQQDYEALTVRSSGFQSGIAKSAQLNKVWRQSSIMSAVLAQFIVNQTGRDAIDDGSIEALGAGLTAAVFNDVVLTGKPTAPTSEPDDSSVRIATTEFVKNTVGNFRHAVVIESAKSLQTADAGTAFSLGDGASVILPPYSSVAAGAAFLFVNVGAATKEIVPQGGDLLSGPSNGVLSKSATRFQLLSGDWALIVAAAQWEMSAGSPLLTIDTGAFEHHHDNEGYERSPTGKIEQWGSGITNSDGEIFVRFPKRFPKACYNVVANHIGSGAAMVISLFGTLTQNGVTLRVFNQLGDKSAGWEVCWRAIGV